MLLASTSTMIVLSATPVLLAIDVQDSLHCPNSVRLGTSSTITCVSRVLTGKLVLIPTSLLTNAVLATTCKLEGSFVLSAQEDTTVLEEQKDAFRVQQKQIR